MSPRSERRNARSGEASPRWCMARRRDLRGSANAALFNTNLSASVAESAGIADSLLAIADDVPSIAIAASEFDGEGMSIVDLVARVTTVSKSEARRLVQQGGVSVNDRKIADANARLTRVDALDARVFLLRKGSRQRFVIRLA